MSSRVSIFSSPYLLGFDEVERLLDRATKSAGDGYPPYNIARIQEDSGSERLRITLAVAGFSENELDISVEENQLAIRGKQMDDGNEGQFLHRGIAARQFQRSFVLADGVEVTGANLENGLLSVDLIRKVPEQIVRKVKISTTKS
ncbi:MAG: Hsp20 family protein [Rhizobiales bacterium]|nr:Hsp20 family protein [Hyphomicrobiales bacterium]